MNSDDEEENPDMRECEDCGIKGECFYEDIGMQKYELNIYWNLGEPDRCEECFAKWKDSEMSDNFLEEVEKVKKIL